MRFVGQIYNKRTHVPKDRTSLRELLKTCTSPSLAACYPERLLPPADSQNPLFLLLHMKYGTKMNYTQHLLIWHAKYTGLMRRYRSFSDSTPVPQCDKAVTPHLCAPTEPFCRNVLLIHLIFHVTQRLTSHCRLPGRVYHRMCSLIRQCLITSYRDGCVSRGQRIDSQSSGP